ncbi:MAG: DPP IV N-terminal domain-containing protein [Bacteroidota bacterium]|nr:DPP IV N-terminal domain-containing protein [Bacteroidota bacterium]MDP4206896.1 DPP IV N-terminal domain-containing protein [Bacteroidota bacterium]
MKINLKAFISIAFLLSELIGFGQVTKSDYQRADSTRRFNKLVYQTSISPEWVEKSHTFWYRVKTRRGEEYYIVDSDKRIKKEAFDQNKLSKLLSSQGSKLKKAFQLGLSQISFNKDLKEMKFTVDSVQWQYKLSCNKLIKLKKAEKYNKDSGYWAASRDEFGRGQVISPDGKWIAFIRNYNVYIRNLTTQQEFQLSYDGSEGDFYSSFVVWSPDSKKLATNKVKQNVKKYIYFVESSPVDQLQPKLQKREYLKPGDVVPIKRPSLFDVEKKVQIPIDATAYENQFDLSDPEWWKDSRGFTFEFNQRGHQRFQLAEVNASDGAVKILVDETSNTFVEYTRNYHAYVNDGKEIIWKSQRDGWFHLYLIDGESGKIKNQITKGEWIVRNVVDINEEKRQIVFSGSGRNPGEDPYLIHYYRINFDGTGLVDLTPENGNHTAWFSSDYAYLIDSYSRIDFPTVTVLRDGTTGNLIKELEKADIADLVKAGWKIPEVFSSKGRDGKTDIWGLIYRPSNFDPSKKYPIVEYIYAGPGDNYVPKSFTPFFGFFSPLAELGFIVVQIDGMGTGNRSKAFEDVCWKNLKEAGVPDRILWMKAAAQKYAYMDTTRVGIFGASAGGQNAMSAVLFHPEFYKASVAACGCHDNRMDKIWWNELWMGYPIGPHYAQNSNVENAGLLKSNLMLIVGEVDDNVDPATTMQVVNALIKAKKEFELIVLPGVNHTMGGDYGERKRRDFFVKHLLGQTPPDWNN